MDAPFINFNVKPEFNWEEEPEKEPLPITKNSWYKGFDPNMTCRGKKYEEGHTYIEPGGNICEPGMMHFCRSIKDCLMYYPLFSVNADCTKLEENKFATVTPIGEVVSLGEKCATDILKIGKTLTYHDIIESAKITGKVFYTELKDLHFPRNYILFAGSYDERVILQDEKTTLLGENYLDAITIHEDGLYNFLVVDHKNTVVRMHGRDTTLISRGGHNTIYAYKEGQSIVALDSDNDVRLKENHQMVVIKGNCNIVCVEGNGCLLKLYGQGNLIVYGKGCTDLNVWSSHMADVRRVDGDFRPFEPNKWANVVKYAQEKQTT